MSENNGPLLPFRLRKKKILLLLGILLGYLLFVSVYIFFFQKSNLKHSLENNRNTMMLVGNNLTAEIDNISNMSQLILINDRITRYLIHPDGESISITHGVVSELYNILVSFHRTYSLFVFRNDGQYVSTGIGVTRVDTELIKSSEWRAEVEQRAGGYVLKSNRDGTFTTNTANELLSLVRNINDVDTQKKIGLLVINLPVGRLADSYRDLTDENRVFGYYDEKANANYSNLTTEELDRLIASIGPAPGAFSQFIDRDAIFSAHRVEGTPLVLVSREQVQRSWDLPSGMITAFFLMFVMILVVILLISELIEKEKSLREKELAFLQEQFNPHFLYNTINSIASLALEDSCAKVFDALETLGEFYHNFLSRGSAEVPLRTEIEIVKDYLKLQRLRYQDNFEEIYELDESLLDIRVPKLILQPLVENCLYHGIQPKGEKGLIRLRVFGEGTMLHIVIRDNGIGMSEEMIRQAMGSNHYRSFGFRGTIERIQNYYDRKDVFSITSEIGKFTEITLVIPMERTGKQKG